MDVVRGLALLLLLVPLAGAQEAAFYGSQGVEYYAAAGHVDSGNVTLGLDHEGLGRQPFLGCAEVKLRADHLPRGIIDVRGQMWGQVVDLRMNNFAGPTQDVEGGIAFDVPVDGSRRHAAIQHPAVTATVAAWGSSSLYVGGAPMADPVTGQWSFDTTMFITPTGFREDETGRIRNSDGSAYTPGDPAVREKGDWEMHLRVESPSASPQPDLERMFQQPEPLVTSTPFGQYLPPDEDHVWMTRVANERFGGNGSVTIQASSAAPMGNDVTFTIVDPVGQVVHEAQAQPTLGQPFSTEASFPLEHPGFYTILARGSVNLAQYSITFVQQTPESFDLSLWWEDLLFGSASRAHEKECREAVDGRDEQMSGTVVGRLDPPRFPWTTVQMTIAGIVSSVLVGATVALMAYAHGQHKRMLNG